MLTCQFCGHMGSVENDDFEIDKLNKGFWCETCDGYTYLNDDIDRHRFTLILEDKSSAEIKVKSPDVKLSKRLSIYRYPGGKSRIIDYLYTHLQKTKSKILISPFTGGGNFELAMLDAGIVEKLHLNDLDTGVYSLWWTIKHMPYVLIDRIKTMFPNHEDFFKAQTLIKSDYKGANMIDAAWASLLVNRLAYSGIFKANPLGGRNGSKEKLLSRWNPTQLVNKIEKIHSISDKIEITQENAIKLIEEAYWNEQATIFIDPPYVKKGRDLYHCYYSEEDHRELAFVLNSLYCGVPGADIIVTYDYNEWLNNLYDYPEKEIIGRTYSA